MRVIITGATGFIGTALCREMLNAGHSVTAIIRPNSPKRSKLPREISVIELELDRISDLAGNYDVFYHLAWNGSSGNDRNDFYIQQSNIIYTVEAIKAAKRCGCYRFIGAGSQAEYGVVRGACTEKTLPNPFMMYGAAKLAAYQMGKIVAEQEEISFIWPRIYSIYGVGENSGTLLSYVIKMLKEGKVPEISSCENMWDFMYITDCTAALRLLGEQKDAYDIYNISYGKPQVLKEYIEQVRDIVNPYSELGFGIKKTDFNKTFWLEPNITKLKQLGFKTKIHFVDGIKLIMEG